MDPTLLSILILGLLFLLLTGGMPIGFAMGLSAFLGTLLLIDGQAALALLGQTAYETALTYNLSVIPMFVLMGYIAGEAGLNESLYRACNAWLGHRRGGLALATIGGCGAFAAICGSSLATAATMAQIALPEMRRYKYDDRLATGAVAAGGTIGILIPPSVIMVIYGLLTETSISALFLAGILPGILTVLGFMLAISIMTRIDPKLGPPAERSSLSVRAVGAAQRVGHGGAVPAGDRRALYRRVLADRGRQRRGDRRARARAAQPALASPTAGELADRHGEDHRHDLHRVDRRHPVQQFSDPGLGAQPDQRLDHRAAARQDGDPDGHHRRCISCSAACSTRSP